MGWSVGGLTGGPDAGGLSAGGFGSRSGGVIFGGGSIGGLNTGGSSGGFGIELGCAAFAGVMAITVTAGAVQTAPPTVIPRTNAWRREMARPCPGTLSRINPTLCR